LFKHRADAKTPIGAACKKLGHHEFEEPSYFSLTYHNFSTHMMISVVFWEGTILAKMVWYRPRLEPGPEKKKKERKPNRGFKGTIETRLHPSLKP